MRQSIYHKCGRKLLEYDSDTTLVNFIGYCGNCKTEVTIDILKGQVISIKDLGRKGGGKGNETEG